jgi:hypothetical protein
MPTFLVKQEKTIIRQEGDTADVVFNLPEIIDPSEYEIKFSLFSNVAQGTILFSKTDEIIVEGQQITVPILPADTLNKQGEKYWELSIETSEVKHTIGKGIFKIVKIYGNN